MAGINTSSQHDNGKVRRKKSSLHIDMTPMVDLGFLLITFFMLTATLLKPYVVRIQKEKVDESTTHHQPILPAKNLLTLVLEENNRVYWFMGQSDPEVHQSDFSPHGIRDVLFRKKAEIPKLHVFIKASDRSKYQNLIDVMDEMMITGIEKYSLMDITQADKNLIAEYSASGQ